ncbi:MAG: DUF167 domain-containing protein [Thermoplasmata archaeon]
MSFYLKLYVVPNSSEESIEFDAFRNKHKVKVREKAVDNQANIAVLEFLAKILNIDRKDIKILKGAKSREKLLIITAESVNEETLKEYERRKNNKID